jgi:hypothetical protein
MSDAKCTLCGMEMKYHGESCTMGGSFSPVPGSDTMLIDRAIDRMRASREAAHLRVWAPILWDEGEAIIREIERLRPLPNIEVSSGAKTP